MRAYEEIMADISVAARTGDGASLYRLAEEMRLLGTARAAAAAENTLAGAARMDGNYASAFEYYGRALALYEEMEYRAGVAMVAGNMGVVYQEAGDSETALEYCHRALALYEELDDRRGIGIANASVGNVCKRMGAYSKALEYYRKAIELYEELGDRNSIASLLGNIGNVYQDTGDYPTALEYHRRALVLFDEVGDRHGMARVAGDMSIVYERTGDYQSALDHFHRALAMQEELGYRAGVAHIMGNIGYVYLRIGDIASALEYCRRALAMFEDMGIRHSIAIVTGYIIEALLDQGSHDEAADLLAQQSSMDMTAPQIRSTHFANLARCAEHEGDLDGGRDHLMKAIDIAKESDLRPFVAKYHKSLRDLAQKRNDFAGYIEHNNEYNRITEEIRGKEATQRLAMMEAERKIEAELRERDKERALLYGALPESVATRMLRGEDVSGDLYDNAAVLFLDIVGFTTISDQLPPSQVVHFLEQIFSLLDEIVKKHELTKIKTIGDSYLAVSFPRSARNDSTHSINVSESIVIPNEVRDVVERAANAALEMLDAVSHIPSPVSSPNGSPESSPLQVRIGLHCGALTAGVLGKERLQYDVWGDTVNVASRMESTGEPGRIHISSSFALALKGEMAKERKGETDVIPSDSDEGGMAKQRKGDTAVIPSDSDERSASSQFPVPCSLRERGALEIKGKGLMTTYWLERA